MPREVNEIRKLSDKNKEISIKQRDMSQSKGKIIQVIGPVVDVSFEQEGNELPRIFDALEIKRENGKQLLYSRSLTKND